PEFNIEYNIKDYMISAGGKLFAFQLPSLSYSAYGVGKDEREFPLYFGSLISNDDEYIITLPDNYKIYYMPDKFSHKSEIFDFEASYTQKDNKIIFKSSFKRLKISAEKEAYFDMKKCFEKRADLTKEWIVIERDN
ncbi:hypothetical protein ACFL2A_02800, partial [Thermodesulfobacteriota bacterium]